MNNKVIKNKRGVVLAKMNFSDNKKIAIRLQRMISKEIEKSENRISKLQKELDNEISLKESRESKLNSFPADLNDVSVEFLLTLMI